MSLVIRRWFVKPKCEPMPSRFEALAAYNTEVSRGLAHTPEYQERMRLLQTDFDVWRREAHDGREHPDLT
jgi:hypothetical protein